MRRTLATMHFLKAGLPVLMDAPITWPEPWIAMLIRTVLSLRPLRSSVPTLGSVSRKLLHQSPVPVVVVGDRDPGPGRRPVVVGVDNESSRAAAHWAGRFAAANRRPLMLVHALSARPVFPLDSLRQTLSWHIDPALAAQFAEEDLQDLAAAIRAETAADLDISIDLTTGSARRALTEVGASAEVIVLGKTRGHPFTGSLIGPVMRHVLTHGDCPIVVVPSPEG